MMLVFDEASALNKVKVAGLQTTSATLSDILQAASMLS